MRQRIKLAIDGPAHDETISSFLDRAASFWDINRSTMAAAIGYENEDEDPDAPSLKAIAALSEAAGFPRHLLEAQIIEDGPAWLQPDQRVAYCPLCWAADIEQGRAPYFRRSWAQCSALACDDHRCLLYKWATDAQERRCPPLSESLTRSADAYWCGDLNHANRFAITSSIQALTAFAHRANTALAEATEWPEEWRGDVSTCRLLMKLFAANPSPLPERLAMDRLVPHDSDPRCFAGHRCARRAAKPDEVATFRLIGDPALRRTAWWLLARTLVVEWPCRQIVGAYEPFIDISAWWQRGVRNAISGHAMSTYVQLGQSLDFLTG